MTISIDPIIKTIEIIFFLTCSGSQFGIDNAKYMDIIFVLFSAFCLFKKNPDNIPSRCMASLFIMLTILWGNFILVVAYKPNINAYISYSMRLIGSMMVALSMTYDEFQQLFKRVMTAIAVISLVVYVGRIITPVGSGYIDVLLFFRTANLNGSIRNAGIFWEPGAYQVFLNLAVFFTLHSLTIKKINAKKGEYFRLGVLIATIITTLSTMGYLILIINFLNIYTSYIKIIIKRNKIILGTLMLIALMIISYRLVISENFAGKFNETGNLASTIIRINDIKGSVKIIMQYPLGLGNGTSIYSEMMAKYFIINNSAGLLSSICQVGLLFAVYYIVKIFSFVKSNVQENQFFYLAIIIISGFSENFYFYPIYFIMLFSFLCESKRKEFIRE